MKTIDFVSEEREIIHIVKLRHFGKKKPKEHEDVDDDDEEKERELMYFLMFDTSH